MNLHYTRKVICREDTEDTGNKYGKRFVPQNQTTKPDTFRVAGMSHEIQLPAQKLEYQSIIKPSHSWNTRGIFHY